MNRRAKISANIVMTIVVIWLLIPLIATIIYSLFVDTSCRHISVHTLLSHTYTNKTINTPWVIPSKLSEESHWIYKKIHSTTKIVLIKEFSSTHKRIVPLIATPFIVSPLSRTTCQSSSETSNWSKPLTNSNTAFETYTESRTANIRILILSRSHTYTR